MAEVLIRTPSGEERIPLKSGTLSVGRERFNDIVIPDPKASRKHAQIEKLGDQWIITDLGSSNGTYLRGERISQVIVHENDLFSIGVVQLIFTGVEEAPEDDVAPTTMATMDSVNAKMAKMQAARNAPTAPALPPMPTPAQVAETISPPPVFRQSPPPSPAQQQQNMETMDLRAISGSAPPPPPAPPPMQIDRTMDLAAINPSNLPPAAALSAHDKKTTDGGEIEEMGTMAIMADQQAIAVAMPPPPAVTPGLSNPFSGGFTPPNRASYSAAPQGGGQGGFMSNALPPQGSNMSMPPGGGMIPGGGMPIQPLTHCLMRFVARLIDGVLLMPVFFVMGLGFGILGAILGKAAPALMMVIMPLAYLIMFGLVLVYEIYFITRTGQTFGKRWMGLKVVKDPDGSLLTTTEVIIRMIGYIIASIPCYIGLIWAAFDKDGKGWHDMIAKTRVIKVREPGFDGFSMPK